MKRFNLFIVSFLPASNTKGARLKITNTYTGKSIIQGLQYQYNTITDQAAEYLKEKGFNLVGDSWGKDGKSYLMSDTFDVEFI